MACLIECWHALRGKPHSNIAGEVRNEKSLRPKGLNYRAKWLRFERVSIWDSGGAGFAMCNICKPPRVLVYGNAETRPDERAGNNRTDGGDCPC